MSIIYEALQKTQQHREKNSAPKRRFRQALWLIEAAVVVIACATVLYFILKKIHDAPRVPVSVSVPVEAAKKQIISVPVRHEVKNIPHQTANLPDVNKPIAKSDIHTVLPEKIIKAEVMAKPLLPALQQSVVVKPTPPSPPHINNEAEFKNNHLLSGVFLSEQEHMAIINNQMYHEGDSVDGMKIVKIDFNKVTLANHHATVYLQTLL